MSQILLSTDTSNTSSGMIIYLVMVVLMFVALYFIMIRPNSKKRKKEEQMRSNIQVGDDITTIGGIVGKVVSLKDDDSLVIETGVDRSKLRVKRWSVASCDTVHDDAEEK